MHCYPCLSESPTSPVAVLDTIHGGRVIAERLKEMGIEASAFEVYRSPPTSLEGFKLVVAPIHLWGGNPAMKEARERGIPVITHHRIVGQLLGQGETVTLEVTGTKGKTTTSLLIAMILSHRGKTLSHTTRGLELWSDGRSQVLCSGLSITPANLILAHDEARRRGVEFLVSEVSLGGSGIARIGVLTTLKGDYRIAGGTMWASTAKLQLISLASPENPIVAGIDTGISADLTFGPGGAVELRGGDLIIQGARVPLQLEEELHLDSYSQGISGALASTWMAGVDTLEAASYLEGFGGFPGRMMGYQERGIHILDNSNSGLRAAGVRAMLDHVPQGGRLALVAGEEAATVCEGMDVEALISIIEELRQDIDLLILVGERFRAYAQGHSALWAGGLDRGREMALANLVPGDRMLLGVKCFR